MLRTRLLTASAAVALLAAPAAFAQDAQTMPAQPQPVPAPTTPAQPDPSMPAAPSSMADPAPMTATQPAPAAQAPQAANQTAEANTVVDVLRAQGEFTTLLAALDAAQLTETLNTRPAISIFAPTDAAFAALPEAERTRLMDPANVNELRQILLYHVIVADVEASQIQGARGPVETAARTQVQLDGTGDQLKIDEATITNAGLDASNGAVFSIDRVLVPAASQAAMGDAEMTEAAPAATVDAEASTEAYDTETAPAAPGEVRPTDSSMAPAGAPAGDATMTPSTNPATAPTGEVTTNTTTVASPPVVNPTDGQQDGQAPQTPPVQTPTDDEEDGAPAQTTPTTPPSPQG